MLRDRLADMTELSLERGADSAYGPDQAAIQTRCVTVLAHKFHFETKF